MRIRIALITAMALGLAACGGGDPATVAPPTASSAPASGDDVAAAIVGFKFAPATINVAAGSTITWTNEDSFGHTVTEGTPKDRTADFEGVLGELNAGNASGLTFSMTFDEPGTIDFFCRFHPSMVGTIIVS